jgi:methylmalonyl-CoA/ethylmalonyl-CoA epimerase
MARQAPAGLLVIHVNMPATVPEDVAKTLTLIRIRLTAFGPRPTWRAPEDLLLELFTFHSPAGRQEVTPRKTNDVGGPRHVCLRITNIDEVFAHVKSLDAMHLINDSPEYRPFFISPITPRAIELPGADPDTADAKEAICEIVKGIRFFYAIDRYGIEWEFEEGHADIGTG